MVIVSIMWIICVIANRVIHMIAFDKAEELYYDEGLGFPMVNDLSKKSSVNTKFVSQILG